MSVRVAIHHRTEYHFERAEHLQPLTVRLRPAAHCPATVLAYALEIEPHEHSAHKYHDPYSNQLVRIIVPKKTTYFRIDVDFTVDLQPVSAIDSFLEPSVAQWPFAYDSTLAKDLQIYLEANEYGPALQECLLAIDRKPRPTLDFLLEQNQFIYRSINYVQPDEPGVQSSDAILRLGQGSCRDKAWLLVQVLRHLGVAARFVSGYWLRIGPSHKSELAIGSQNDQTELHAWAEAYLPGAGWVGFDPCSGLACGEGHIPLACAPDPSATVPLSGTSEAWIPQIFFRTQVQGVQPSLKFPPSYNDAQWRAICEMGKSVDAILAAEAVGLMVNSTSRYVVANHTNAKAEAASELLKRLHRQLAQNGIVVYARAPDSADATAGMLCSRIDNEPLWRDAELLADVTLLNEYQHEDAARFMRALTTILGLDPSFVIPGSEQGAELTPTGYALPLARDREGLWRSSHWRFPAERMVLLPGQSAMGWRLPLGLILPGDYVADDNCVMARQNSNGPSLPSYAVLSSRFPKSYTKAAAPLAGIRTALCTQIRDGRLWIFLPCLFDLQDFLELLTAIELVAAAVSIPVLFEGNAPPSDPRLRFVNIIPGTNDEVEITALRSETWTELTGLLTELHEAATSCGLAPVRNLPEGRFVPIDDIRVEVTSRRSAESAFLRRPDLVRSVIDYWQQHPSLSYLFAGLRVGPDGVAPRVDESRDDDLHELQLVLQQLQLATQTLPSDLIDCFRDLRFVLGNDRRPSEFEFATIATETMAVGDMILHGYAMLPDARMRAVLHLLLSSLLALFWNKPFQAQLTHWGTALHDRYLLPYVLWQDLKAIIAELREAGFALELDWFAGFREFRFPLIGYMKTAGGEFELRNAMELWRGLQGTTTTTSGCEAAVDRLQVLTRGLDDAQYIVTCNGRQVPLQGVSEPGVAIAGVRYKARAVLGSLHPTLPVQSALLFEIVDRSNDRAIGACTYHIIPPDGLAEPSNAADDEAHAKRSLRFQQHEPAAGVRKYALKKPSSDYPYTLDLRCLD